MHLNHGTMLYMQQNDVEAAGADVHHAIDTIACTSMHHYRQASQSSALACITYCGCRTLATKVSFFFAFFNYFFLIFFGVRVRMQRACRTPRT